MVPVKSARRNELIGMILGKRLGKLSAHNNFNKYLSIT